MLLVICTVLATAALCLAEEDNSSEPLCRSRGVLLPEPFYQLHTCALCYIYMNPAEFRPGMKWKPVQEGGIMKLSFTNITMSVNMSTEEPEILQSFGSVSAENKWRQCCQKAAECCREMTTTKSTVNDSSWCPRTWDGWLCWPDTPPFSAEQRLCPSFIRFGTKDHNCELHVTKICAGEGHWSGHPRNQSVEWTDYSTCSVHGIMETRLYIGVAAYVITAVALLPALVIFHFYRQLHGHRIALHKNLFMSLLMNAVCETWFKIDVLFPEIDANDTGRPSVIKANGAYCKLLLLHTKYFRLTNYMWMFCEGFYLHRLISAAFDEEKSLGVFYIIGWGFPLLPVTVYAILRAIESDTDCWALPSEPSEWVLYIPALLSLLVNTIFLIDIIRVLVMKLRAPHRREPSQYRKAVRATLVLVPLFGLHFAITMYRPQNGTCQWQELYVYLDILLDGLQGAVVALIFCYINSEVHSLLKRSYRNFLELRNPSLSTGQCLGGSTATTTQTVF